MYFKGGALEVALGDIRDKSRAFIVTDKVRLVVLPRLKRGGVQPSLHEGRTGKAAGCVIGHWCRWNNMAFIVIAKVWAAVARLSHGASWPLLRGVCTCVHTNHV